MTKVKKMTVIKIDINLLVFIVLSINLFFKNKIDVRIRVGPIIGKVTSTSAIVLVEVSLSVEITVLYLLSLS